MQVNTRRIIRYSLIGITAALLFFLYINLHILVSGSRRIVSQGNNPRSQAILVLGAAVYRNGRLSDMYQDRAQTALDLYNAGAAPYIIVSGDNSTVDYDEVTPVKKFLIANGVPSTSVFLDYAGFDTYDSLYRTRDIFGVTSTIVVTQRFHLPRALYIGKKLGLHVQGVVADRHHYRGIRYSYLRENAARLKAWWNVMVESKPKFLGDKIELNSDKGTAGQTVTKQ